MVTKLSGKANLTAIGNKSYSISIFDLLQSEERGSGNGNLTQALKSNLKNA